MGNFVYLSFQIDTNMINARQANENMNKLEKWNDEGVIEVIISEKASDESKQGNDIRRTRKANTYIYSEALGETIDEIQKIKAIGEILFEGGPKNQNQQNDVEIVFNACKYGRILVTKDGGSKRQPGGILGNAKRLADLGIRVMSDIEAVSLVEERIKFYENYSETSENTIKRPSVSEDSATRSYKGYLITPGPYQLAETGKYTLDVLITRHRDEIGETRVISFSASNNYDTKQEAIEHCLSFGMQIIDGMYLPKLSVEEL